MTVRPDVTPPRAHEEAPGPPEDGLAAGDIFVFGKPARLLSEVDWDQIRRGMTWGFFEERDPGCPIGPTLAKLIGAVAAVTGVVLAVFAGFGVIVVWTLHATLG